MQIKRSLTYVVTVFLANAALAQPRLQMSAFACSGAQRATSGSLVLSGTLGQSFAGRFELPGSPPSLSLKIGFWYRGAPRCPTDVDDGSGMGVPDGGVTVDDLLFYLARFSDGNLVADVDDGLGFGMPDGGITIDDLLYYLLRFGAGC